MNMEIEATNEMAINEKTRSTAWLVRCSPDQKDFFQKLAAESGKNAADFISAALESYKIKSNFTENLEIQKELTESEYLIERLTSLIRSKILLLCEKELQLEKDRTLCHEEKNNLQDEFEKKESEYKLNYDKIIEKMQNEFDAEKQSLEQENKEKDKKQDELELILKQKSDDLEEKIRQKTNECQIYQKQVSDSMKLYESVEERNSELKKSIEKIEKENLELKKHADRSFQLDKLIDDLNHKMEIIQITHEQELKRLLMEYELKIKIKEQEVENKYRTS
ncbi:MAG: hypothetical protein V4591_00270 [Bdellovibrionota bacterium]